LFDSLKTQYRPGVNSLESLSKDPLFNPMRTSIDDIAWTAVGITQSQETGIYWESMRLGAVGSTASVVGNFENILLYNAFLEAGDDYKTITIPKYAPKQKEETSAISTSTSTTESKFSGEFTFNVEKDKTFVVVGNQNFTLKIGDLVIVISAPEGFHDTATFGRVSNTHMSLGENAPSEAWQDFIFIDADIMEGSSGGMVLGTDGLVYGLVMGVTGQHAESGLGENSISPSNKIKQLLS
jgi:hypothetical protein